jgi:hypothetical protein
MKTILKDLKKFRVIVPFLAISLLLGSICVFTGCEKYKEGPKISFRSRTERVANTWKFQKYIINGADSTTQKASVTLKLTKDYQASFFANDTFGGTWNFERTVDIDVTPTTTKSSKDQIEIFVYNGLDANTGIPIAYVYNCNILELKQNKMHLKGAYTYTYPGGIINPDTTVAGTFDWTLTKK